jgi:hypothetical protein
LDPPGVTLADVFDPATNSIVAWQKLESRVDDDPPVLINNWTSVVTDGLINAIAYSEADTVFGWLTGIATAGNPIATVDDVVSYHWNSTILDVVFSLRIALSL